MTFCRALTSEALIDISLRRKGADQSVKAVSGLLTMPATEVPGIERHNGIRKFVLPQNKLRWLLEKTMFCMAQQDVRYYLNGLLFEVSGQLLRAVATDGTGFRLLRLM